MKSTEKDFARRSEVKPFESPEKIPFTYKIGSRVYKGFPEKFHPKTVVRKPDCSLKFTVIEADAGRGLKLRAECTEYLDYPVTEWVMYITNEGKKDSPTISDWKAIVETEGKSPVIIHGNGDDCTPNGYEWFRDEVKGNITIEPCDDGNSCNGDFPYMSLQYKDHGINYAIGWAGIWST